MKNQQDNAKVHPSDDNSHEGDDHEQSDGEMKESDIDRTKNEESITVIKEEMDEADADQMDEQESRDKIIR